MKRYFILIGVTISFLIGSCSKKNTITPTPIPDPIVPLSTVTGFLPLYGDIGQVITIKGTNFGEDASKVNVKFADGASVTPKSISATEIMVEVPATIKSGQITVTVNNGTAIKTTESFTFTPIVQVVLPTITGFSPKSVQVGQNVTITGSGFGTELGNVAVFFANGNVISPISITPSQIVFKMPIAGVSGVFTINISGKTVSSGEAITVINTPTEPPVNTGYTYVRVPMVINSGGIVVDKNQDKLLSTDFSNYGFQVLKTNSSGSVTTELIKAEKGVVTAKDGVLYSNFPYLPVNTSLTAVLADTLKDNPFVKMVVTDEAAKKKTIYYAIVNSKETNISIKSITEFTQPISIADFIKKYISSNQNILVKPN
jgi:uncharacterized protein (DUF2062 family)